VESIQGAGVSVVGAAAMPLDEKAASGEDRLSTSGLFDARKDDAVGSAIEHAGLVAEDEVEPRGCTGRRYRHR
jgi:hypothetical protein